MGTRETTAMEAIMEMAMVMAITRIKTRTIIMGITATGTIMEITGPRIRL
jgi:hypothetical protein